MMASGPGADGLSRTATAQEQAREDDDADAPGTWGQEMTHRQRGSDAHHYPGHALEGPREGVVHGRLDHQEHRERREVRPAVRIGRKGRRPGEAGSNRRLGRLEHLLSGDEPRPDHARLQRHE